MQLTLLVPVTRIKNTRNALKYIVNQNHVFIEKSEILKSWATEKRVKIQNEVLVACKKTK